MTNPRYKLVEQIQYILRKHYCFEVIVLSINAIAILNRVADLIYKSFADEIPNEISKFDIFQAIIKLMFFILNVFFFGYFYHMTRYLINTLGQYYKIATVGIYATVYLILTLIVLA